jgi:hypothetical protein
VKDDWIRAQYHIQSIGMADDVHGTRPTAILTLNAEKYGRLVGQKCDASGVGCEMGC